MCNIVKEDSTIPVSDICLVENVHRLSNKVSFL